MAAYYLKDQFGRSQGFDSPEAMNAFLMQNVPPEQYQQFSVLGPGNEQPTPLNQFLKSNNQFSNQADITPATIPQGQGQQPQQPQQPTPPPFTVDQNQPLSTQQTPINQATAPSDINAYLPNASSQQADLIKQALEQSRGTANQNASDLNDLYSQNILAQMKNWTDPNSPTYQQTMGQLNNVGRADQNTFGQSLSSRLAPLISDSLTRSSEGALIPSFTNQQNLIGKGYGVQSDLGLAPLQRYMQQQDFTQQATLANQLADKGQPSGMQSGLGGAASLLGGLGSLGQGLGGFAQLKNTWICTRLKELNLATEMEVEAVHEKLAGSLFKHPIYWLHYIYSAPSLINLADAQAVDWSEIKPVLIDAVLAEPDSEKAFQIYKGECQRLCELYAPRLWNLVAC